MKAQSLKLTGPEYSGSSTLEKKWSDVNESMSNDDGCFMGKNVLNT